MKALLSDTNIEGHVQVLAFILESERWREVWSFLNLLLLTFRDVGLPSDASDAFVWETCQQQEFILLTANRNADRPDSLEVTIRTRNSAASLPVFTLADADQIFHNRAYAERLVERLLEYLIDMEKIRGTGRLYLP